MRYLIKQIAFTEDDPVLSYSIATPRPIESGASDENVPRVSPVIVKVIVPPEVQIADAVFCIERWM